MFSLTRSNLLTQLPDLNEINRRPSANRNGYSFNRNIFLATAGIGLRRRFVWMRDMVISISAFGGAFLWKIGPSTHLIVTCLFGVSGTAFFDLYGTDFPKASFVSENKTPD
ncbi:MAG: hypothetical protein JRE65_11045 [Deltaproteobacteria bacterium]|jgi:hypothetical protein|nr:hypothetical protein [Deltaproteobacteria bacterium]